MKTSQNILQTVFKDVMADDKYKDVYPSTYIPFANIRSTTRSDVLRFVSKFNRLGAVRLGTAARDIACGTETAKIVSLNRLNSHHVTTYLEQNGVSQVRAKHKF